MKVISHRGNLHGPNPDKENQVAYIEKALMCNYEVEIDLWAKPEGLFLGHDAPEYLVNTGWIFARSSYLWLHAKDVATAGYLTSLKKIAQLRWFFHQSDDLALVSDGTLWLYPGHYSSQGVTVVLSPNEEIPNHAWGICTDYADSYLKICQ